MSSSSTPAQKKQFNKFSKVENVNLKKQLKTFKTVQSFKKSIFQKYISSFLDISKAMISFMYVRGKA